MLTISKLLSEQEKDEIHDAFELYNLYMVGFDGVIDAMFAPIAARHDRRVTELLAANNREVERRREAERALTIIANHSIGGVYTAGTPAGDRTDMVLLARETLRKNKRNASRST